MNPKGRPPRTAAQRMTDFFAQIEMMPFHSCWEWVGYIAPGGYGRFRHFGGKGTLAHRYSYMLHKGQIQDGLVLDHICRNRKCVNPRHLKAVPRGMNATENSFSPCAVNKRKEFCKRGHPLVAENLYKDGRGFGRGACKTCAKARSLARHYNDRAKNPIATEAKEVI